MRRRTVVIGGTAAAVAALGAGGAWRAYARDMAEARARIAGQSRLIASRAGPLEYATAGAGPPVLMLHGTGGGFDQGLAMAGPLTAHGWQLIAPSRFGYLRTAFPADAGSESEADAMVDLLDTLGIDRLPVIGGSAGALPALAFAIRHPDRCAALVALVPATHVPGRPPVPAPGRFGAAIIDNFLGSDVLFWAGLHLARDAMIGTLLATDPALVARAAPAEQARVAAILRNILPVSARHDGLRNDGRLAGNPRPMDLGRIRAPTLAISAEDDRFGTADAARHIASAVPGAQLHLYPEGGHVWVGHDADLFARIDAFLRGI